MEILNTISRAKEKSHFCFFLHSVDTLWDDTAGNSKADIQSIQRKKASYAFKNHCGFGLMIILVGKMTTMGKSKKNNQETTKCERGNE